MSAKQNTNTPIYSSNRIYNTSLLSSSFLYRVVVKDPPEIGLHLLLSEDEPRFPWPRVKEILVEAPTVIVAIMTARELGYQVTHVECMYHD
jgi:hypothetical protein